MTSKTNPVELPIATSGAMNLPGHKNGGGVHGALLQARDLALRLPTSGRDQKGERLIHDISLHIQPGEFVIVAGGDRLRVSRLLQVIAGLLPPDEGEVLLDGVGLYAYRKIFRSYIGFASGQPAVHDQLTPEEALEYEARLQMPGATKVDERHRRVRALLSAAGLQDMHDRRLGTLGNVDRQMVNVAVELLKGPALLVVESPYGMQGTLEEARLVAFLRESAHQGTTILYATDLPRAMAQADKLVLLTRSGELAWFGPPDEALAYFHGFSNGLRENGHPYTFDDVLMLLSSAQPAETEKLAGQYQSDPAFKKYIDGPMNDRRPDLLLQDRPLTRLRGVATESQPPPRVRASSGFAAFIALLGRGLRVLSRDRRGLWMLLAPVLAALTDFLFSSPGMLDPISGNPAQLPSALGVIIFLSMLVAALLFHPEVVQEQHIVRREARARPVILPYVISKLFLALLFASYSALVWVAVHYLASGMSIRLEALPGMAVTLALVALVGGLVGLFASSLARAASTAAALAIMLVVLQLLFSGPVIPLERNMPGAMVAAGNPAHYAFETLLYLSDYGRDVASDGCWLYYGEQRNTLTDTQKQSCNCMGENIVSKCNFPGIRQYFGGEIEQARPPEPSPEEFVGQIPAQPPRQPGQTFDDFEQSINRYTLELEQYTTGVDNLIISLHDYAQDLENWQRTRSLMVGNAEGEISHFYERYGHSLVVSPVNHWLAIGGFAVLLVVLLALVMKGKGAAI